MSQNLYCPLHWILTEKFQTLFSPSDCVVSFSWLRTAHQWLASCRCWIIDFFGLFRGLCLLPIIIRPQRFLCLECLEGWLGSYSSAFWEKEGGSHTLWVCIDVCSSSQKNVHDDKFFFLISRIHGNSYGSMHLRVKISVGDKHLKDFEIMLLLIEPF